MKFDLSRAEEVARGVDYFHNLKRLKAIVEIKKVAKRRSLPQNNYLHLLLSGFGAHFGYTLAEAKLIYKELNRDIYEYEKKGRTFYRSSADLTKDEMTKSIERFREKSAEAGYPLPTADNQEWLMSLQNTIEMNERYL